MKNTIAVISIFTIWIKINRNIVVSIEAQVPLNLKIGLPKITSVTK